MTWTLHLDVAGRVGQYPLYDPAGPTVDMRMALGLPLHVEEALERLEDFYAFNVRHGWADLDIIIDMTNDQARGCSRNVEKHLPGVEVVCVLIPEPP